MSTVLKYFSRNAFGSSAQLASFSLRHLQVETGLSKSAKVLPDGPVHNFFENPITVGENLETCRIGLFWVSTALHFLSLLDRGSFARHIIFELGFRVKKFRVTKLIS